MNGSRAIATDRETTQSTIEALEVWAAGLTSVYLEGAVVRALQLAPEPLVLAQLSQTEYAALEDAELLQAAATSSVRPVTWTRLPPQRLALMLNESGKSVS